MTTAGSSYLSATFQNLKALLVHPTQVASICPSSPFLTSQLSQYPCIQQAELIVEIGPGNGETTTAVLNRMAASSRLLAIERNDLFIESLHKIPDRRLCVRQGDASQLSDHLRSAKLNAPDVIISGIPFSSLSPEEATRMMRTIHSCLRPGGIFLAYQLRNDVCEAALPFFGTPEIDWVWMNVPPLRIFRWTKWISNKTEVHRNSSKKQLVSR